DGNLSSIPPLSFLNPVFTQIPERLATPSERRNAPDWPLAITHAPANSAARLKRMATPYFLFSEAGGPSIGTANTLRPSGKVIWPPAAWLEPSFALNPWTWMVSPILTSFLFQPARDKYTGGPP